MLENIGRGSLGIAILIGIAFLLSADRKQINWNLVAKGLLLQITLGILILKFDVVRDVFDSIAGFFTLVLKFTEEGANFVLGRWPIEAEMTSIIRDSATGEIVGKEAFYTGYVFAFKVLPTIIFFSALSAVLYYLGILQKIIFGFAWVMRRLMNLSGAESLAAAANVFIGQTEAPLIVKPYLEKMSKSEMLCLMTGGMATIAGGVFAAYIGFLGGADAEATQKFATHLLTASIMSAPAAIVAAKILYPETRTDLNESMKISDFQSGSNLLDAISRGTTDGLKLAVNVGAMLLVFTALIYMVSYSLEHTIGEWTGLNEMIQESTNKRFSGFNMEYILGLLFAPFAWILGVPTDDILVVGQLLGKKTAVNEFVAYADLGAVKSGLQEKSLIIATYALCGFSNFASIGIQIGGIGAIAPGQRENLSAFGIKALIGGTLACFLTAAIAGMLI